MGIKTHWMALRYPDVSVFCGRDTADNDAARTFDDPKVIFEVLSQNTADHDLNIKLREYQALPSTDALVYADPIAETVRVFTRDGRVWNDATASGDATIDLPSLGVSIPLSEIFARD